MTENITAPIAYLTGEYPRATDTFIQREVAALRNLGIEVLTCSVRRTGVEQHVGEEQRREAAATYQLLQATVNPLSLIIAHSKMLVRQPGRYFGALRLAWASSPHGLRERLYQLMYFLEAGVLAEHLCKNGVVHLHNHIAKASCTVAMLTSKISNIPFSFTLHGPDIFYEPYFWRLDIKIQQAAFVACISDFCRSQAMVFSNPDLWSRLNIVHCGVNPERYTPTLRSRKQNLLFVGRLAAVKGLPILMEALKKLVPEYAELQLTIVGDGPDRKFLENQAKEMRIDSFVNFVGYKSQSEVAEYLSDTDVMVLPSFAEGVPVVLMEAMAAQVPAITTKIAGIPELVRDGVSGILVPPGNSKAIELAIRQILDDPRTAFQMGVEGRKTILAEFTNAGQAQRLAELINTTSNKST